MPASAEQPDGPVIPESLASGLRIVALRALGHEEDAADAVQETLARAIEAVRKDRIPPGVSLPAFVHGIARHVIADVLRRRGREHDGLEPDRLAAAAPSPLDHLVRAEELERVQRALARLPHRDRDLLRRCFVDGERLVDIARDLGEPAERVRKRKSRALERLREMVARDTSGHVRGPDPTLERR